MTRHTAKHARTSRKGVQRLVALALSGSVLLSAMTLPALAEELPEPQEGITIEYVLPEDNNDTPPLY